MDAFLVYLLKSAMWLLVFGAIYYFFLRKQTYFRFNRIFLLSGLLGSAVFPLLQYHYSIEVVLPAVSTPLTLPVVESAPVEMATSQPQEQSEIPLFLILYISGALFSLLYCFLGLSRIQRWYKRGESTTWEGLRVVRNLHSGTFSFFNLIFLNDSYIGSDEERRLVLRHEQAHIRQQHWVDVLLVHIISIVQWFNPIVYLYRKFIRDNQEYLADEAVLQQNTPSILYQAILINHTLKIPVFSIINSFSNNQLNRIKMMKTQSKSRIRQLTVLLVIPALACFIWAFAEPEYQYTMEEMDGVLTDTVDYLNVSPENMIYFIDNKESSYEKYQQLNQSNLHHINTYERGAAANFEGDAKNGVVLLYTQDYQKKKRKQNNRDIKNGIFLSVGSFVMKRGDDGKMITRNVEGEDPLFLIDGKETDLESFIETYKDGSISERAINTLDPEVGERLYGAKGKYGVINIVSGERFIRIIEKQEAMPDSIDLVLHKNLNAGSKTVRVHKDILCLKEEFHSERLDENKKTVERCMVMVLDQNEFEKINPDDVEYVRILKKDDSRIETFASGRRTQHGAILIRMKNTSKQ